MAQQMRLVKRCIIMFTVLYILYVLGKKVSQLQAVLARKHSIVEGDIFPDDSERHADVARIMAEIHKRGNVDQSNWEHEAADAYANTDSQDDFTTSEDSTTNYYDDGSGSDVDVVDIHDEVKESEADATNDYDEMTESESDAANIHDDVKGSDADVVKGSDADVVKGSEYEVHDEVNEKVLDVAIIPEDGKTIEPDVENMRGEVKATEAHVANIHDEVKATEADHDVANIHDGVKSNEPDVASIHDEVKSSEPAVENMRNEVKPTETHVPDIHDEVKPSEVDVINNNDEVKATDTDVANVDEEVKSGELDMTNINDEVKSSEPDVANIHEEVKANDPDVANYHDEVKGSEGVLPNMHADVKATEPNVANVHDHRNLTEQEVASYPPLMFGIDGAGLKGEPVVIDRASMSETERQRYDEGYKLHDFNTFVSDMISVDRAVPDTSNPLCQNQSYSPDLPDTSVIICFRNEAWSVLVRSVHSVINTAPPQLLREIILVDDFSDYDYLKRPLESYMGRFSKVKILRNSQREGLIRSRLVGARYATGEVLTFLDSHIECVNEWLPPLLARIAENSSHVVWPEILDLNPETFEAKPKTEADRYLVGGFDWSLRFRWTYYRPEVQDGRTSAISPLKSPTMSGGLFAMDRDYFFKMGAYDEGMDFWGGENLELSFRIWMCGGSLEIISCSVIYHIFRTKNPNKSGMNAESADINTLRMANVWMDNYKEIYFMNTRRGNLEGSYGDISSRLELRKILQCHDFQWYIDNVYPTLFLPSKALSAGNVQLAGKSTHCLHASSETQDIRVYLKPCGSSRQQIFYRTIDNEVRQYVMCVDVGKPEPVMYRCHGDKGNQELLYREDKTLWHPSTGRCLGWNLSDFDLHIDECDGSNNQQWQWVTAK